MSSSRDEGDVDAEVTVPDPENLENSAPEVSLTDEDLNYSSGGNIWWLEAAQTSSQQ